MDGKLNRREFIKKVGYSALLGSYILGCAEKKPQQTPTPTPTPTPPIEVTPKGEKEPVKIGGVFSMSGVVAAWGRAGRMGAMMAAKEINEEGGILGRKIALRFEDDTVNPEVGVRKVRKLALEWGADLMLGSNSSGVALAIVPVLKELKKIYTIPCAASPRITTEAFNKYVFRVHPNCYQIGAGGAAIAAKTDATRWTVIGPDYSYGYDSWGAFITHLIDLKPDIEVLEVQAWPKFAAGDYTSHIVKLLDAEPEGVYSPLWGGDFITFVKQAQRYGFFDKIDIFLTPAGLALDAFYGLKTDVPLGIYSAAHGYWFEHPETARNKDWVSRFVDMWGEYPHIVAHDSYSIIYLYRDAAEKAGTLETDAMIEQMEGMKFTTPGYDRYIRKEDHQAVSDVPWGVTAVAEELLPFKRRLAGIVDSEGEKVIEPIDEVLARRKKGGSPPWMKYVIK